jgi:hypothetical protein
MTEEKKPDLSSIPPIGKLPDEEPPAEQVEEADRVGRTASVISGTPPAVGVTATTEQATSPSAPSDEEAELEKLRRG